MTPGQRLVTVHATTLSPGERKSLAIAIDAELAKMKKRGEERGLLRAAAKCLATFKTYKMPKDLLDLTKCDDDWEIPSRKGAGAMACLNAIRALLPQVEKVLPKK